MNNIEEIRIKLKIIISLLDKKAELFEQIYNITENQEMFIKTMQGEDRKTLLDAAVKEKQDILKEIMNIDKMFLSIFEKFRGSLNKNKDIFKDEISIMQDRIRRITNIDVKIKIKEKNAEMGIQVKKNYFQESSFKQKNILGTSKNYILEEYKKNSNF